MAHHMYMVRDESLAEAFEVLDIDDNGFITASDLLLFLKLDADSERGKHVVSALFAAKRRASLTTADSAEGKVPAEAGDDGPRLTLEEFSTAMKTALSTATSAAAKGGK